MKFSRFKKKGDVSDVLLLVLIVTFLSISFIVVLFVNDTLKSVITDTALNESSSASTITASFDDINTYSVQRAFVIFFGILIIGIMASAFLVRIHPAFLFLYIIILGFTILISVFMGNLYETVITVEEFAAIAEQQTMITFIMQNIVKIALATGALSIIIIFAKIFPTPGGGSADI